MFSCKLLNSLYNVKIDPMAPVFLIRRREGKGEN